MLRRGELNFLSDYRGDPKLLIDLATQQKDIQVASTVDMGLRFVGHNLRRPPFDDRLSARRSRSRSTAT